MKLSKNNKIYITEALKDKSNWQNYSETKAASICTYNSDIVLNLSLKELQSYNIDIEEIDNFLNFAKIFKNEENHKKLLQQIVIKSENPFISSMLNMNRVSKVKYFVELICLNRIEIKNEYKFFNDFFEKIHKHNYLYIYRTNKINEFAEIRFSINVEDLFTKTYVISKIPMQEQRRKESDNLNRYLKDNKMMNMNNTTIKEVTEDEKNRDSIQQFNFNCNDTAEIIKENIGHEKKHFTESHGDVKENEPTLSRISVAKLNKNNSKRLLNDQDMDKFNEMEDLNSNECENNFLNELENIERRLTKTNEDNSKKDFIDFDLEEVKDKYENEDNDNNNNNNNKENLSKIEKKSNLEPERDKDSEDDNENDKEEEKEKSKSNSIIKTKENLTNNENNEEKEKENSKENIENSKESKKISSKINTNVENSAAEKSKTREKELTEIDKKTEENKNSKSNSKENEPQPKEKDNSQYLKIKLEDQIGEDISPIRKKENNYNTPFNINNIDEERKFDLENNNNKNNNNKPENIPNSEKENKKENMDNKYESIIRKKNDFPKDENIDKEFNIRKYNIN